MGHHRSFGATLCTLGLCGIVGCNRPETSPPLSRADLYRLHCSGCHGDGSGNGHVAQTLKTRPRNLRHAEWQMSVSDAHIVQVIRDGGAAVKLSEEMPAFRDKLSELQIDQLAGYVRQLGH